MRPEWIGTLMLVVSLGAGSVWAVDQNAWDLDHKNRVRPAKENRFLRPEAPPPVYYCKEEGLGAKDVARVKNTLDTFGLPSRPSGYLDDRQDDEVGVFNPNLKDDVLTIIISSKKGGHHSFGDHWPSEGESKGRRRRTVAMDAQISKDKNTLVVTATMDVLMSDDTKQTQNVTMTVTKLEGELFRVHYRVATLRSPGLALLLGGPGMRIARTTTSFCGTIGPRAQLENLHKDRKK